jgi:hypothetical protein
MPNYIIGKKIKKKNMEKKSKSTQVNSTDPLLGITHKKDSGINNKA